MRTVDNMVAGLGPRWNPDERVQSFTHPLWMFLLCVPYGATRDAYFALLATSLLFTVTFLAAFLRWHARRWGGAMLALLILGASKSFVDFSTSGLENPLIHLLLALAYALAWDGPGGLRALLALAFVSSLGAFTRPDALLLFLPALCVVGRRTLREGGGWRTSRAIVVGFAPWLAWLAFSVFYYGAPEPNTALAKLGTGLSIADHLQQSWFLLLGTAIADPVAILALLLAAALAFRPEGRRFRPFLAALLLWQLYLCWAGGDFAVGRLYTPVIVLASMVLARSALPRKVALGVAAISIAAIVLSPVSPLRTDGDYNPRVTAKLPFFRDLAGAGDERAAYFRFTGLFRSERTQSNDHPWTELGLALRKEADRRDIKPYLAGPIGMVGFYAGPRVKIIDQLALADPLLARLPMHAGEHSVLPGHYLRRLPAGYRDSRRTGENRILDDDLAAFYDALHLVIAGKLWSRERFRAIWAIHFGEARESLERYRERYARREVALDTSGSAGSGG